MNWAAYHYPPQIVVDWDGTCIDAQGVWLPGAVDALEGMALTCPVLVHSASVTTLQAARTVRDKLNRASLHHVDLRPPNAVGKPHGAAFIDDRAVPFTGDWPEARSRAEELVHAYRRIH